jgi:uncharacterized protein
MTNIFLSIYNYLKIRKPIVFILVFILFGISGFLASRIRLEEDITMFMPSTPETERSNYILRNISTNDKIIITLAVNDSTVPEPKEVLMNYADSLADSLWQNTGAKYIKDIFYKVDDSKVLETSDFLMKNLPLFLNEDDYTRLDSLIGGEGIRTILEENKKNIVSPVGLVYKRFIIQDPLHISNRVLNNLRLYAVDSLYTVNDGYIFSKDGKNLLMFITSTHGIGETGENKILAESLDKNFRSFSLRSRNKISITSFGAAIVGVSNASRIKQDSYLATAISLVLIIVLLFTFFRSKRSLILILVPVIFGAAFGLAILFLIKGTVSAIALGAGSIILGISVNYSLHFLAHYKHCGSVEETIKDLVSPMTVGNITTVGAFLSLLFVSAEALRDFGLFAALALIGTTLFVLIFMPHFVSGVSRNTAHYPAFFDKISDVRFENNRLVILTILILTIVFLFFSKRLTFESDLNKLSYMTNDQKKAFNELSGFTTLSQKSLFHVSEGSDLNEALVKYEKARVGIDSLRRFHYIKSVSGIGDMLMSDDLQKVKISRWKEYWNLNGYRVTKNFNIESSKLGFKPNSFDSFLNSLSGNFTPLPQDDLIRELSFVSPYIISKPGRTMIITLLYVDPGNESLVKEALGKQQGVFVFDRLSATKATLGVLSKDFNVVGWSSAILVLVFLTISFGRLELSLLTFIPMLITGIWILGSMAILDVRFNIVNIILATFIFGLGDDYSIFIMEGSVKEHSMNKKILGSYKLAVILSALTMFIGIGTLVISRHPAMKSLGTVTIIGMVSVVIIAYTILPFLYRWLNYKNGTKRTMPVTIRNVANSIYSFGAFLTGSIFHSILGFFLFKLTRPNDRKKLFFHKCLAFTAGFVVKRIPNVKTRLINRSGETFDKPAIIISNHQSHIDLMLIMMLSPRIVILTNEWVWNSPFYKNVVRYADFYPVINGIESSIEHLENLVKKGYSIMIFPEGTRSVDCSINRFHRGAFYLAEQLGLDIIPVMIHGMGHVLPKTDFMLRKGNVTVEIMDRIASSDKTFGETYSSRAKMIRAKYKEHYKKLASEIEIPEYFSDKIYCNYLYKGAEVTARVKADLSKHRNYDTLIRNIPDNGEVLIFGSDVGTFPMMLSFVRTNLGIEAVERNEEKLAIADNSSLKTDRITYLNGDPLNFCFNRKYETIILLDCLSSYNETDQKTILINCVENSLTLLLCEVDYSWQSKLILRLRGAEFDKIQSFSLPALEKLTKGAGFKITQKDNIFAISRPE